MSALAQKRTSEEVRLGHGSPVVTMSVYAHLFDRNDGDVANAIDKLFKAAD